MKTKAQFIGVTIMFVFLLFGISEGTPATSSNGMYLIFAMSIVMMKTPASKSVFSENYSLKDIKGEKILIITNVYDYGSIGKIVRDCHVDNLKNYYNSYVIVGRGKGENLNNVCYIESDFEVYISKLLRKIFKSEHIGNYFMTKDIICAINDLKPNIIHITALNDDFVNYKRLLKFISKKHIKVVYTHHSEYFYLGGCGGHAYNCNLYREKMCRNCPKLNNSNSFKIFSLKEELVNQLRPNLITTSVSPWLHNRVVESAIFKNVNDFVVMNGSSINKPSNNFDRVKFLESNNLDPNKLIVLHVTPSMLNVTKKFCDVVKIAKENPSLQFLVLTLKKDRNYEIPKNMIVLDNVNNQNELAKFYFACDVTLLTGTIETFSMPVIESLLCGTPVVGYKCGGPESIALSEYSIFSENGDYLSLSNNLKTMLNKKIDKNILCEKAKEVFSSQIMAQNYRNIYATAIGNQFLLFHEMDV